ncbi:helix-turn-helix transcriptional regulator [Streptomyces sp. CMB-StM0423]|uniref:helix-turn-helix transcriptional regulator n=1 Tax=Streptomyces sp. CMB-StM0423 TaxID=2059884 RepID=UPI00131B9222|nr:helix-turn-helix transcriptional regulator [Streptomyces sp. CMB-StM0423]
MSDDARVSQPRLGELLKEWRKRAQYRFGSGSRITQKYLADRTGIGWRTYQALEAGEPRRRLSPATTDALARELGLAADERDLLFVLAARVMPGPGDAADPDAAVMDDLRLVLDSAEPTPAVVLDAMWNVQMHNRAIGIWFPYVREPRANVIRWSLSHPDARTQIVGWDHYVHQWLGILRKHLTDRGARPDVQELVTLIEADPVLRAIWEESRDIRTDVGGERSTLRLPCHGGRPVEIVMHVLSPGAAPHYKVGILTPITPTT